MIGPERIELGLEHEDGLENHVAFFIALCLGHLTAHVGNGRFHIADGKLIRKEPQRVMSGRFALNGRCRQNTCRILALLLGTHDKLGNAERRIFRN